MVFPIRGGRARVKENMAYNFVMISTWDRTAAVVLLLQEIGNIKKESVVYIVWSVPNPGNLQTYVKDTTHQYSYRNTHQARLIIQRNT